MQIIKHNNGVPIEGTQMNLPETWDDIERGITIIKPTLEDMANYNFMEYVQPETAPETLQAKQARVWESIKAERERRRVGGVMVAGKWFHTDDSSRIQYLGLKDSARDILLSGGTPADPLVIEGVQVQWKTMDGSFVPLTVQAVFDIVSADKRLDASLYYRAEVHNAQMMVLADPTGYDYSAGWTATYEPS